MEFLILVYVLWVFARWVMYRIQRQKDDERFARVIDALNKLEAKQNQFKTLETRIHELERRVATSPTPSAAEIPVMASPAATSPSAPVPKTVETPTASRIPPWPEVSKAPIASPPEPIAPKISPPVVQHEAAVPPSITPAPKPPLAPPVVTPAAEHAPVPHAPTRATSTRPIPPPLSPPPTVPSLSAREITSQFEEKLGTNWLNKIGITILVIGISLFLAIKFPSLSNPEKIGLGYLVSLAILGTGVYLEKKDRYRIFARALIGGGWALTFFTTYAMHFVTYTRVIDTQWIDLVLLFLVAAVMVVHTLRYDSQVVTGLAFLLAFTTVAISQNTIYSLSAGVILALGLVTIVHRRQWFELEVFGILASYLNHFLWLAKIIVPMAGHHRMFPEFVPSCVLLCLYWAVYRWSYIARRIQSASQETVSAVAAILNTSLLLFLFKYQSVNAEFAFYALIILGAAELAIAHLPVTRERRAAFVILSSIGNILLVAAIPFKFSGMDMAIIWLAEAQILLVAGVFLREVLFRRFGFLVALLTSGDMLVNQAFPALYDRLPAGIPLRLAPATNLPDYQLSLSFLVAAVLFYANSLGIPRQWSDIVKSELEEVFFRALSYLAALMLFIGLVLAFPNSWTAVAWAAAAFALLLLGRTLISKDLINQTHIFAFVAFVRAVMVNTFATRPFLHTGQTLRLVTLSAIIAFLYLCARWLSLDDADSALHPSELYTSAGAFLVVILTYQECHWAWIGIAWGALALALAVLGLYLNRRDFSIQAHVLVLAGFARTLVFNIDASQEFGHFTLRLITFSLMAVLLYMCAYFSGPRDSAYARLFSALHTFAGSLLISVLAFKEVSSPWIAVSWALFAFFLLIIGDRVKRVELHIQAYILTVLSLFQLFTVNIRATGPFRFIPGVSLRLVTFAMVATLFYLCSRWAAKAEFIAQAAYVGAAYTWGGSFLVGVLLYHELPANIVALGWAVFAVALFELGVFRESRNWRLQGYAGFGMAFLRMASFNLDAPRAELFFYTLPLALVFYYAYVRLTRMAASDSSGEYAMDEQIRAPLVLAFLGSGTLVLFAQSNYEPKRALIAFAVLSLLFIGVAWATRRNVFLYQSVILAVVVFFRALIFEFPVGAYATAAFNVDRVFAVGAASAFLLMGLAFAFPLRARFAAANGQGSSEDGIASSVFGLLQRPEQIYFFLPMILVTLLIFNEVSTGRVTIFWGMEAVAVFLFALVVGERSFRLAGLSLLMVCVGKIVVLDVWRQQRSDRYITFIILGVALLLVSFLYTRYSEAIHRYL